MKTEAHPTKGNGILDVLSNLAVLANCWLFRQPQPQRSGVLQVRGLSSAVEVLRDKWDVPHIYALSLEDLFFAQGYIHAQERLFQMDFQRRIVAGRLSEILGEVSLPLDRWMRTLTMYHRSEQEASKLTGDTRKMTDAYVSGINAFISSGILPMEIRLLHYQPEQWKLADIFAWSKMLAFDLAMNWETEINRALLIRQLGNETEARLEPPYPERWKKVIPAEEDYSCIGSAALKRASDARPFTDPPATDGLGSNNWVISGARTTSGKPLLSNDMHLGMGIPSLWYENHLVAADYQVSGISFPGLPFVIQGHNRWVSWGFTMSMIDVQDLYIEHLRKDNTGKTQYEFMGKWADAKEIEEVIQVKGGDSVTENVIVTTHGPVINLLAADLSGEAPLALCWTALLEDAPLPAFFQMNTARNCGEFRDALRSYTDPSQNVVYADIDGNIAYTVPGRIPVRARGQGLVPVPGWTGEYEWTGYIPFEDLPHLLNPAQGYVATANNKITDDGYPYWLGKDYCTGFRYQRIQELIESREKISVEDICRMQVDRISIAARNIGQHLASTILDKEKVKPILARFKDWDGNLAVLSPEAAIYEVFVHFLIYQLLQPVLGDLTEYYAGKGPTPVIKPGSLMGHHCRWWLHSILEDSSSSWWSNQQGLTRKDHIQAALAKALEYLEQNFGPEIKDWQWGKIHQILFAHNMGSVKPLDRLVNRGPYPMGGDIDTVWMGNSSLYALSGNKFVGPQFRFIGDLSDWNNSLGVIVPGQSGHPASKHYADGIHPWLTGQYHPMLFDRAAVMKAVDARLQLIP